MEDTDSINTAAPERPGFLTTLCILSYIGSGIWALFSLLGIFSSGKILDYINGGGLDKIDTTGMSEKQLQQMEALQSAGMIDFLTKYLLFFLIGLLVFSLVSLLGVARMWKQKKAGFWIYTIVNVLLAILLLAGGSYILGIVGIAFIVMYGLNLKHMS